MHGTAVREDADQLVVVSALVEQELDASKIPNLADVYTYAKSSDVVGVDGFIMGIGLGYRKDLNAPAPSSWKDREGTQSAEKTKS